MLQERNLTYKSPWTCFTILRVSLITGMDIGKKDRTKEPKVYQIKGVGNFTPLNSSLSTSRICPPFFEESGGLQTRINVT